MHGPIAHTRVYKQHIPNPNFLFPFPIPQPQVTGVWRPPPTQARGASSAVQPELMARRWSPEVPLVRCPAKKASHRHHLLLSPSHSGINLLACCLVLNLLACGLLCL
ncbi:hypothetical protein PVAP13_6NG241700 [Panicum virgatum]|uniref:Uncharacterized protein n=1 Tax=Panicum virgatum TaxID=38727 RepID=A0A8T0R1R0_PANVG|nr:hypothetical protein PVAP13_6NG241700 [Panicum virgatum]